MRRALCRGGEPMDDGTCITCTSGDEDGCTLIQGCCDRCAAMLEAGCTCRGC